MNKYVFYYPTTGEIRCVYVGISPEIQDYPGTLCLTVPPGGEDEGYVVNEQVVPLLTMSPVFDKLTLTANGADVINITGAPVGATFYARNLTTNDVVTGLMDGTDAFLTTIPGIYKYSIELFPYEKLEGFINAV